MKGLRVEILKHEGRSCDAGRGISSKVDTATLIPSPDFPYVPEIFEADEDAPAVVMVKRSVPGCAEYPTAYPADDDGKPDSSGRMMSGCYISACDSRFPAMFPVPLHDRKEW